MFVNSLIIKMVSDRGLVQLDLLVICQSLDDKTRKRLRWKFLERAVSCVASLCTRYTEGVSLDEMRDYAILPGLETLYMCVWLP